MPDTPSNSFQEVRGKSNIVNVSLCDVSCLSFIHSRYATGANTICLGSQTESKWHPHVAEVTCYVVGGHYYTTTHSFSQRSQLARPIFLCQAQDIPKRNSQISSKRAQVVLTVVALVAHELHLAVLVADGQDRTAGLRQTPVVPVHANQLGATGTVQQRQRDLGLRAG